MIRAAVPGDLVSIMRISRAAFTGDDRFGTVWLIKKLAEPGTRCMVDDAGVGAIRGYVILQEYNQGTVVRLIAVDRGCRKQGVASRLLSTVNPRLPAGAWVRVENEASKRTFLKAGWKVSVSCWAEPKKPKEHTGDWLFLTNHDPEKQ